MVKSDSGKTKKLCLDENVKSLEEDLKYTGRNFDRSYTLQELDEGAILEWWTHFHERWDLIWQNCCRTIIQGLRAGGSDKLLPWATKTKYWLKVFWTPDDVEAYCLALLIGEFGRRISWTKWCLVSFIVFALWILNRRRYKSHRKWSARTRPKQDTCILEHKHLGIDETLPVSDGVDNMNEEELEETYASLRQRFESLTRCISELQKQPRQGIEVFTNSNLEETYHSTSEITPPWFRALFMDGPKTFELEPTFPTQLLGTSYEYKDLSTATFQVTMSFTDESSGVYGGLFVTEKLKSRKVADPVRHNKASHKSRHTSSMARDHSSQIFDNQSLNQPKSTSNIFDQSDILIHPCSQSQLPVLSQSIYSNYSGVVLLPACSNTEWDWLTNFSYGVLPLMPIYRRRVVLSGKFEMKRDDSLLTFEKRFRIIFLLGEDGAIRGIYRRQMTTEPYFLTWKIIFP